MYDKISVNKWNDIKYNVTTIQEDIADDLFISCISYEPRTIGILKKLDKDYKADMGLFVINEKFEKFSKVQENKKAINDILAKSSFFDNSRYLLSSIDNPIKIIIEIDKILKTSFANKRRINITFDVTTFPRGELLTVIYYLRHLAMIGSLRTLYVSPEKYGDWLTEGYKYSTIPPFFEGPPTFERKTALFILTGFEYDRAVSLIEDVEPSALILGRPIPGTSDEFRDTSERIIDKLRRTRKIVSAIYDIPANNPFSCREILEDIIQEHSKSYDFFVAIMGTKLEVLGAYLAYEAREQNPIFRIIYPIPLVYNIGDYSFGCRDVYEIILKGDNNEKKQSKNT